ncbi:DUF4412 domain-containing protein [Subsaximicrobium wynnwilliamsii]|uniref:DUF4412 domain-containing protein n=1 Tax=Subsaximicrobium wynnwilliamsii TaxID=291179 RepID=A0A5C6ZHN8_9FLAO|nr:DUF4412 domain-containing protein [Subsaximicrobium wynnwilliamsii]TXD83662.1 DUF4412 domain-containing protein [Subsaximicrobium wynnwilliamsii]TXD89453.1 DUF4412 domain-containing protein [Subsaximicrobium wynnwilliamsii]TXE03499.1 DUF4412 domain-containing protein [Subsaximicrobium wynnwilliamsii]
MKTKHLLTAIIVFFLMFQSAEAQFLKKLKKRVEQKVENAVIEKTANKAAEKATKSMDKAFDINPFGGGAGKEKADPSLVANSYDFTWKYSLKMSTKDGEIVFDYFLNPGASYFGFTSATMDNMFTVMDNDHNIMVMFMASEGNSTGMVTQMPDVLDLEEADAESAKFTFETLPEKTINGYRCKGVKATSEDYEMLMYFTNETKVSFDDIFKNSKTKIPVELKDYFDPDDKVLMISMDMKDLKNEKQSAKMECVGLEKVSKTVNKSDYKFM